jgi:Integrase core domain
MIRDPDCIYGAVVTRRLRAMGIRDKPIAPASPWQNGFAERLIGSIRRECLDHVIVLGEAHLRRILKSYARYYIERRTHLALDKDAPAYRCGQVTCHPGRTSQRRKVIDEIERILDLMRDTGRELTERGEFLGLHKAVLRVTKIV